jgi:hypothetical protein
LKPLFASKFVHRQRHHCGSLVFNGVRNGPQLRPVFTQPRSKAASESVAFLLADLALSAVLWPGAARPAFLAGMAASAGRAGACFSGVRPSEIGPGRPRFPWAFGGDSSAQRARAAPDTFVYVPPMPKTWRNRLRNKPLIWSPLSTRQRIGVRICNWESIE